MVPVVVISDVAPPAKAITPVSEIVKLRFGVVAVDEIDRAVPVVPALVSLIAKAVPEPALFNLNEVDKAVVKLKIISLVVAVEIVLPRL